MRGLKGKVAIVAGAAPGNIGAATVVRLAEGGTAVVAADLNEAAARAVVDQVHASGGRATARTLNITDDASYQELVAFMTLTRAALANTTEEYRSEMLASVRSPRLGVPEDIAAMVAFLLSDDGAYINGQEILVDGGANFT